MNGPLAALAASVVNNAGGMAALEVYLRDLIRSEVLNALREYAALQADSQNPNRKDT